MSENRSGAGANGNGYKVPTGRAEWIVKRKAGEAERTGDWNMSQMHFARKGLITEEVAFTAQKEKDFGRTGVAERDRQGNDDYSGEYQPPRAGTDGDWGGVALKAYKINANIGNSAGVHRMWMRYCGSCILLSCLALIP